MAEHSEQKYFYIRLVHTTLQESNDIVNVCLVVLHWSCIAHNSNHWKVSSFEACFIKIDVQIMGETEQSISTPSAIAKCR